MIMWNVKAIYPHGSHVVHDAHGRLRFADKMEAMVKAEILNAVEKKNNSGISFIVVEEN